jgi:mRNA interferase YafQ
MIKLVWHKSFIRDYKKTRKKYPEIKEKLEEVLNIFVKDPYQPILGTHKLSGKLKGHHAFSLGYDLRVVFKFIDDEAVLISLGSHEEVY